MVVFNYQLHFNSLRKYYQERIEVIDIIVDKIDFDDKIIVPLLVNGYWSSSFKKSVCNDVVNIITKFYGGSQNSFLEKFRDLLSFHRNMFRIGLNLDKNIVCIKIIKKIVDSCLKNCSMDHEEKENFFYNNWKIKKIDKNSH